MQCTQCGFANPAGFAFCGKCGNPLTRRADSLTQEELDQLGVYLPSALLEAFQFEGTSPPTEMIEHAAGHLSKVQQAIYTHLPPHLIATLQDHLVPGQSGGEFVDGTLLFADISGFTAMSERLSRIGREGAEEVTAIVNRYFSTMLALLQEQGGQLIKFGGDALLGAFLEPTSAVRAVQAALLMQAAMADFTETRTSQGVFPLRMKIGLHRGRFFAAHLGTADGMEYTFVGPDVNATAVTESVAETGQVVVYTRTLEAVDAACDALALAHNSMYWAIDQMQPLRPPGTQTSAPRLRQSLRRLMDCGKPLSGSISCAHIYLPVSSAVSPPILKL